MTDLDSFQPGPGGGPTTERRNGNRYELLAQVQVKKKDINEIMEVKNVSVTGVLIATTDRSQIDAFTIDGVVDIDIFSTQHLKNISVRGRIVRGQKSGDEYTFGIEFIELTQKKITAITQLVEMAYRMSGQPPLLPFQT